jgi:hypothetical protein
MGAEVDGRRKQQSRDVVLKILRTCCCVLCAQRTTKQRTHTHTPFLACCRPSFLPRRYVWLHHVSAQTVSRTYAHLDTARLKPERLHLPFYRQNPSGCQAWGELWWGRCCILPCDNCDDDDDDDDDDDSGGHLAFPLCSSFIQLSEHATCLITRCLFSVVFVRRAQAATFLCTTRSSSVRSCG